MNYTVCCVTAEGWQSQGRFWCRSCHFTLEKGNLFTSGNSSCMKLCKEVLSYLFLHSGTSGLQLLHKNSPKMFGVCFFPYISSTFSYYYRFIAKKICYYFFLFFLLILLHSCSVFGCFFKHSYLFLKCEHN